MIRIGTKPIIKHIIDYYKFFGVKHFIIAAGYILKVIKDFFKNSFGVNVVNTGINTLTGGRLLRLKKLLPEAFFFLTYGDGLSDVNIHNLYKLHLLKKMSYRSGDASNSKIWRN